MKKNGVWIENGRRPWLADQVQAKNKNKPGRPSMETQEDIDKCLHCILPDCPGYCPPNGILPKRDIPIPADFIRRCGWGWTTNALAKHYDVSPGTIYKWRKKFGLTKVYKKRKPPTEE